MPPSGWTKVNIDGATRWQPGEASCGGIYRMYRGFMKGSFALPLGTQTVIFAEIIGFITALELADMKK